jgi:transglutaminase-like putative cysteine protease
MKHLIAVAVLLGTWSIQALAGDNEPADIATRFQHYHISYYLNDDRSDVMTVDYAETVLKERALDRMKRASITYSTAIEKAEVLTAYTRKADGRRIDAPKSNYQVEVNGGKDKSAPVFSDLTTLTVVFPEVAVGDTVVFVYKITQTEPMFPGHFSVAATFPRLYAYDDVKIDFNLPSSLWVQYEGRQMGEKKTEKDGRKLIEWTFENKQPLRSKRRDYSVYDADREPGYALSTFRSYAEIAEAYGARARAKAAVSERVRKLADEITRDQHAPREQARALYDWVATNISYAGNCIGVGAVVPHDISFILDNRMGDCKDHATLLQALLAARGIASTQALVNAGSTYRLPRIPVASTVNHVINYIPSLELYADSTAETMPFGMLPFFVADKPVLLVDGYGDGARTPALSPGTNEQRMKTVVKINDDGSIAGSVEISQKGMYAVETRAGFRHLPKDREEDLVKNVFQSRGYIGSGTLQKDDPTALRDAYRYGVKFEMKDFIHRPGAGALTIAPVFSSNAPISRYVRAAVDPVESVDVSCSNGLSIEEYTYRFPKDMKILALPDNMSIKNDFLSYHASYVLKGNTLQVQRVFDDRTRGNVCSPALNEAYKQFAARVMPNVKAQVVYK